MSQPEDKFAPVAGFFLASILAFLGAMLLSPLLRAQTSSTRSVPSAGGQSTKVPDLSGDWANDPSGIGGSLSLSDPHGRNRGKEDDVPYQPWALTKTLSEKTPTGSDSDFEETTDPNINYCEPVGLMRIYMWPSKNKFIQTPETVYILYEYGVAFRVVRLNSKHADDPDPQWWGDSIGWYENGDTLVVDTVGLNDKTWLDQVGHPHTDKLHLIERYKRVDADTLDLDVTVDDPGAYTKIWHGHRVLKASKTGFLRYQWVCSTHENEEYRDKLAKPALAPSSSK